MNKHELRRLLEGQPWFADIRHAEERGVGEERLLHLMTAFGPGIIGQALVDYYVERCYDRNRLPPWAK